MARTKIAPVQGEMAQLAVSEGLFADIKHKSNLRHTIPQAFIEELPSRFRYAHVPLAQRGPFAQGS